MTPRPPPGKRILVVEDNEATREALTFILEGSGYQVCTAANGQAALDVLHAGERPDLIVLDLMMPVMDGWQFRAEQRQEAALADIPVVVCSAASDLPRRTSDLGAVDVLSKPVEVEDLLKAVRRFG